MPDQPTTPPAIEYTIKEIAAVHRVLSNLRRLALMHYLWNQPGPVTFTSLCEARRLPRSTCSRILDAMKRAKLVAMDRQKDKTVMVRAVPTLTRCMTSYFGTVSRNMISQAAANPTQAV